jgi:hypothetical protein
VDALGALRGRVVDDAHDPVRGSRILTQLPDEVLAAPRPCPDSTRRRYAIRAPPAATTENSGYRTKIERGNPFRGCVATTVATSNAAPYAAPRMIDSRSLMLV